MKCWEALSILIAARNGDRWRLFKQADIEAHQERARRILRRIGMTEKEINDPFPEDIVQYGLYLLETNPGEFTRMQQCQLQRN